VLGATVVAYAGLIRLVRRMERRADAVAHHHDPAPGTYARALERVYAFNVMPAVIGARGAAHPDLYDRMLAAGVTPDYPRPRRPSSLHGALGFACLILLPILTVDWVGLLPAWLAPPAARRARAPAAPSGQALELTRLGLARESAGDVPGALSLFEAAAEAEPHEVWPVLILEHALIRHGRCEEAQAADETVRQRVDREPSMREAAEATRLLLARCRPAPVP
jgi:hypothetical protein